MSDFVSKPSQSTQLPLQLPLEAALAREDIVVTQANSLAVSFIDAWPNWPGPVAVLAGPVGAGKTHLAHVWAAKAEARFLEFDTEIADLEGRNFVIENIAQGAFSEVWLFHLINAVREAKGHLLITSRRWPLDWGIALPDLKSRIKAAHLMELNEPDDALLIGVMSKLFADRQLMVDPSVVTYVVNRMERSLASAQALAEEMDRLSLASKRPVTKPLASEALRGLGLQD